MPANSWWTLDYLNNNTDEVLSALREHVVLTVESVVLGAVIAVPLALLARRGRRVETAVLGSEGVLYSLPSLAVISLLLPIHFFGLTTRTVIVMLASYNLLIITRNTLTGLQGVPADVVEAASGMGYGRLRLLARVELPLALPSIVAGLRVATVSTVALVTIGAFVSHGGLGTLILDGYSSGDPYKAKIMTATVLCVALAILADLLLLGVLRLVTPWQRRRKAASA